MFGLIYLLNTTLMNRGHVICELTVSILIINQAFKCSDQSELKRQVSLWDCLETYYKFISTYSNTFKANFSKYNIKNPLCYHSGLI